MDPMLAKIMENNTPKLNRDLAEGLSIKHLEHAERYVDDHIRRIAPSFPEELKYLGFRRCTPQEEYRELTRKRSINGKSKSIFELARSDIYLVAFIFSFEGEEIIRYIALPYINQYGTMFINGVRFTISPVLCDKVISVSETDIFAKLNLAKLIFKSTPWHFNANGNREVVQVIYADVYNRSKKNKELVRNIKAETTMLHYILCRYGFDRAMREFAKCDYYLADKNTDLSQYPEEQYVICSTGGMKPKSTLKLERGTLYHPSDLKIIIPKDQYTSRVKNYLASLFYLIDHWPQRITIKDIDNVRMWKHCLGELIWGAAVAVGRLEKDSETHLDSLDKYIDPIMEDKLAEIDIKAKNIYELFANMVDTFNERLRTDAADIPNVYKKELEILYYVLDDISKGINRFYFDLMNNYTKKKAKDGKLEIKEVRNAFNKRIHTLAILNLSNTGKHIEVSTINSSCDNKAFKTTAMLVPQEKTGAAAISAGGGGAQKLHVSVAEVNAYSAINKKDPSGRNRINLCVDISETGAVQRDPNLAPMLDAAQERMSRKT